MNNTKRPYANERKKSLQVTLPSDNITPGGEGNETENLKQKSGQFDKHT
jgi:hypothetical protein